ncbi:hypothetical protein PIB30_061169 [Stylosanthes scabra]|uniref:Uncharacterized protein n=1 Tax=Stylosanthes scabra TaxID=79078 RepID=A0ABU6QLG7_9FABA|nr:hypothetical protein [Stylosanthes scabra]
MKEEIPIKCEDPGPCIVTCSILGIDIPDCLCDLGACGNVIPFKVYEHLDLGPLKKSREVFTTTDARDKGGRPQVLLGRPFLKTAEFKLIYYDEILTFSVENVIEIFHLTPLPKPPKKGIQQLKMDNAEARKESPERKAKMRKNSSGKVSGETGTRNVPPQSKGKKKRVSLNLEKKKKKKKKEPDEDRTQRKRTLKCLSFTGLLGKLKVLKDVLCRNKSIDAHLVKNNSKWK